jgi:hypothetical protein
MPECGGPTGLFSDQGHAATRGAQTVFALNPIRDKAMIADRRACEEQALRDQDGAAAYIPGVEVVDG